MNIFICTLFTIRWNRKNLYLETKLNGKQVPLHFHWKDILIHLFKSYIGHLYKVKLKSKIFILQWQKKSMDMQQLFAEKYSTWWQISQFSKILKFGLSPLTCRLDIIIIMCQSSTSVCSAGLWCCLHWNLLRRSRSMVCCGVNSVANCNHNFLPLTDFSWRKV